MKSKKQDQIDELIERAIEMAAQYWREEVSPNIKMKPRLANAIMERTAALTKPLIDLKVYQLEHSLTKTILIPSTMNSRNIQDHKITSSSLGIEFQPNISFFFWSNTMICKECKIEYEKWGNGIENNLCPLCSEWHWREWEIEERENLVMIDKLQEKGHSYHCACRQVWGDGQCECDLYEGYDPYAWIKSNKSIHKDG